MLPNLGALSLESCPKPTGEFIRLSRAEARKLNNAGVREPINKTKYMPSDCEPSEEDVYNQSNHGKEDDYECFEPFKVWIRDAKSVVPGQPKSGRPGRDKYLIYNAEALWDAIGYQTNYHDPTTRQPFWREDWYELHDRFDPDGDVPRRVRALPRKDKSEGYDTEEDEVDHERMQQEEIDAQIAAIENAARAHDARAARVAEQTPIFGRFWLKGTVAPAEQERMEDYLGRHLRTYMTLDGPDELDVDNIEDLVVSVENANLVSDDRAEPMPAVVVDFRIRFDAREDSQRFLEWINDMRQSTPRWDVLAQQMFGVTPIFRGNDVSPQYENHQSRYFFYRSSYIPPTPSRERYDREEPYGIVSVHGVDYEAPLSPSNASARARSAEPTTVFGRFWVKGGASEAEADALQRRYLLRHLKAYMRETDQPYFSLDELQNFESSIGFFNLATGEQEAMDAMVIDFRMTWSTPMYADRFLYWTNGIMDEQGESWNHLAERMFGIDPILDMPPPYQGFPQLEDYTNQYGFYQSEVYRPTFSADAAAEFRTQSEWAAAPKFSLPPGTLRNMPVLDGWPDMGTDSDRDSDDDGEDDEDDTRYLGQGYGSPPEDESEGEGDWRDDANFDYYRAVGGR